MKDCSRSRLTSAKSCCAALLLRYEGLEVRQARSLVWEITRARIALLCRREIQPTDLVRSMYGKPVLARSDNVWFNVSHAMNASLIATSCSGEIGCDIENRWQPDDFERVGPLVLHENEQRFLGGLVHASDRSRVFAKCWVRKEAALKARGFGFAADARSIDTRLAVECPLVQLDPHCSFNLHDSPASLGITAALASVDASCLWEVQELTSAHIASVG